jgi:arabinan endo-1,5-alpha-L-arabinosidase
MMRAVDPKPEPSLRSRGKLWWAARLMRVDRRLLIGGIGVLVALGTVAAYAVGFSETAYKNPVLHNDAPDPTVIKTDDGFYAYTTQSYYGTRFVNIPILHSPDLIHWRLVGDAFPERPQWVVPGSDNGDLWAPHITHWEGTYYLFYSARSLRLGTMAIGVATSPNPIGPFEDKGKPLITGNKAFDAIDPFAWETPEGEKYVYWGSAGAPIRAQKLTPDGAHLTGDPVDLLRPSNAEYEGLIEGAWMMHHGDFYYLMYSGDACCGPNAHYAVGVARGSSPLGPFRRDPDNPILEANADVNAPGHHATVQDDAGQDWILYHAMVRGDITNNRYLFLDRIEWVNGWPMINGGKGPSIESADAPVVEPSA